MICTGLSGSGRAAHPVDAAVRPRDVDIVMKPDRPVPLPDLGLDKLDKVADEIVDRELIDA